MLGILIEVLFTNEATYMVLITKPHSAGYSRVSILFISLTFTNMLFTNEATYIVLITKPHSAGYSRVSILFISLTITY